MRDRSSKSCTKSPNRRALRSIISTNDPAAAGSVRAAVRRVSAADITAAMGVRSSCETLPTKSLRTVSRRRTSVTSKRTTSTQRGSPDKRVAWTNKQRGRRPATSISPVTGSWPAIAASTRICSSALRTTSMAGRPTAPVSSSNISRSDPLKRRMRRSLSSTNTPSRIASRMRPSKSRSSRSSRSERDRFSAR